MKSCGITDPIISWFTLIPCILKLSVAIKLFQLQSKSATCGLIQSIILGLLLLPSFANGVFNVVRNCFFLTADDSEIVYNFQPEALGSIISEITQGIYLVQEMHFFHKEPQNWWSNHPH